MAIDEADRGTSADRMPYAAPGLDAASNPDRHGDARQEHANGPVDSIRQLLRDARAAAEAEVELVKAYAGAAGQIARRVGMWAGAALIAFSVATMAGAIGLIITLAAAIGPGMATMVVTGLLVLVGVIALLRARSHLRLLRRISNEAVDQGEVATP